MIIRLRTNSSSFLPVLILCAIRSACGEYAAKCAGTGAVSGAVGGLVGAQVFDGNAGDTMAPSAVYGGAVGATAGAMGAPRSTAESLRAKIGDDACGGLEALADCKYDAALKTGRAGTPVRQS